jgi:hypothetical protein
MTPRPQVRQRPDPYHAQDFGRVDHRVGQLAAVPPVVGQGEPVDELLAQLEHIGERDHVGVEFPFGSTSPPLKQNSVIALPGRGLSRSTRILSRLRCPLWAAVRSGRSSTPLRAARGH